MIRTESTQVPFARWALVSCLALLLAAPASVAAQSRFSGIVVFGTSLSDSGNSFALVGDAGTPPDFTLNPLLVPTAPYAKGGHHFSNGATWVEQYARSVGLAGSVRPALAATGSGATNFAVGAARAYDDGVNFNLSRQVDTFLLRAGGVASPQAVLVIEMGGNDIRDAFLLYATGGTGAPVVAEAGGSIAAYLQWVFAAGGCGRGAAVRVTGRDTARLATAFGVVFVVAAFAPVVFFPAAGAFAAVFFAAGFVVFFFSAT